MSTKSGHCHVANCNCKAPPGYRTGGGGILHGTKKTKLVCYECDEFVCSACSTKKKGKRLCDNCREYHEAARARLAAKNIVDARLKHP